MFNTSVACLAALFAFVYSPSSFSVTIHLSKVSLNSTARWRNEIARKGLQLPYWSFQNIKVVEVRSSVTMSQPESVTLLFMRSYDFLLNLLLYYQNNRGLWLARWSSRITCPTITSLCATSNSGERKHHHRPVWFGISKLSPVLSSSAYCGCRRFLPTLQPLSMGLLTKSWL